MESIEMATPSIGGQRNVITALKTLLDRGIVEPICQFHACLVSNKQERRISKATVKPALKQVAARDRKKLNSGVRVRCVIKFTESVKFKVNHISKNHELVKFKVSHFSKKSRVSEVQR
jgi:hypothetical protein